MLERPLTLWNHLDIDFAEESRMCIQNRSHSPPASVVSAAPPMVSPQWEVYVLGVTLQHCRRCCVRCSRLAQTVHGMSWA